METLIRTHFTIVPGKFENDGDGFCFEVEGREYTIPVQKMVDYASPIPSGEISATSLKSLDPDNVRGWHVFFDAWADMGIIPK